MGLILLGHVIGEFYLLPDSVVKGKKKSVKEMLLHCILYIIPVSAVFTMLSCSAANIISGVLSVGIIHFLMDLIELKADAKYPKQKYRFFIADQMMHMAVLLLVYIYMRQVCKLDVSIAISWLENDQVTRLIPVVTAALICWKPAAIFIAQVFQCMSDTIDQGTADRSPKGKRKQEEVAKIGSCIGVFEREIILILGMIGQYGAIGFVLTAKSIARYKQLEEQAFAEKYLVGTLLSTLIAISCVVAFRWK